MNFFVRSAILLVPMGAVVLAAVALGGGDASSRSATRMAEPVAVANGAARPLVAGRAVESSLTESFAVFRQPQTSADRLGARNRGAYAQKFFSDQSHRVTVVSPVRGVGRAVDQEVLVAAGPDRTVCVLNLPPEADGPGGQCLAADVTAAGRNVVTHERGAEVDIFGVVPNGVSQVTVELADGQTSVLRVTSNVYSGRMPGATKSITYRTGRETVTVSASS